MNSENNNEQWWNKLTKTNYQLIEILMKIINNVIDKNENKNRKTKYFINNSHMSMNMMM
jgi:hypothetical protein